MAVTDLARFYQEQVEAGLSSAMQVDPDRREEPGIVGDSSLKDLLAHLAYWDRVRVARLGGTTLTPVDPDDSRSEDEINAEQFRERAEWDWDTILDDVISTRDQLIQLLGSPSDVDMSRVGRHWAEHGVDIEAWLARNQTDSSENIG